MQVNVNKPSTVSIRFINQTPRLFRLYDANKGLYFFRYTDGLVPRIKFNIPDKGIYTSDSNCVVDKIVPIEIPNNLPKLPPAERDRVRPIKIVHDENLVGSPVVIYTQENPIRIVTGKDFFVFPSPIRLFLLLHEAGHQFYKTEEYCDLYALVNFIRMGYNASTGYYSLIKILGRSKENISRIKQMFKTINSFTPFNSGI